MISSSKNKQLKQKSILDKEKCLDCKLNTICGGGCIVQRMNYPNLDCQKHAFSTISEFINLTKDKILEKANPNKIVSISNLWNSRIN